MLDTIGWGNPLQKHLPFLEDRKDFLDPLIPQLTKFSFPKNSSKGTREELNLLVDYVDHLKKDETTLKRYMAYDKNLTAVLAQVVMEQKLGDKGAVLIDQLIDDTKPLIVKLKYHFQRPRPNQLAYYYKLKLFPFQSATNDSPSFPSGHTLQARVICDVLGNHFPEKYDYFDRLAKDIEYSRLYLGCHYPSDNDYSLYIADVILSNKEFKKKYSL